MSWRQIHSSDGDILKKRKRHTGLKVFLVFILIIGALVLDSNFRITTPEYEIADEEIPESFDGFKIIQLSDLHNRSFGEGNEKLLEKVKKKEPDIIAVTGDLTDSECEDLEGYVKPLMEGLCEIAPVFYVSGNHEWAAGYMRDLFDIIESCGVTVLRNEYVGMNIGDDTVVLAGTDDPNGPYDMKTPKELMAEIREEYPDEYIIVLNHRNDVLDMYSDIGADLVICGHAHGGLIRLPFTDGLINPSRELFPDFTSGIYEKGDTKMVVSRGLGWGISVPRFLNNPHIPTVVLKAK